MLISMLHASVASKLYEQIFLGIFPEKQIIKLYSFDDKKYDFQKIIYTNEIYNCNLIFTNEFYRLNILANKPIFVSSIIQLKEYDNAIGGLIWERDEPKIVFIKQRLEKFNIKLKDYLEKYIVDEKVYSF